MFNILLFYPSRRPNLINDFLLWWCLLRRRDGAFWHLLSFTNWPVIDALTLRTGSKSCFQWLRNVCWYMTQEICGSVLNCNWISGRFNLFFPYSVWWQHATLWFWWHWRCRCHLPWHCSPCRMSSSHAQEGSCVCCMGHHAPAKTQSLWSWAWSWKAYEAQSHHRMLLAKPAIIAIILVLVCGWLLTKYHITIVDKCSLLDLNSISLGSLLIKCVYVTDTIQSRY